MSKIKKFGLLFLLPVIAAGCSSVTNLTPSELPREASGYYRVEAMWQTKKATIRPDTIRPVVVADGGIIPMRPVPLVQDRWEAFVPMPAGQNSVHYFYKFDYMKDAFGHPKPESYSSVTYQLTVAAK